MDVAEYHESTWPEPSRVPWTHPNLAEYHEPKISTRVERITGYYSFEWTISSTFSLPKSSHSRFEKGLMSGPRANGFGFRPIALSRRLGCTAGASLAWSSQLGKAVRRRRAWRRGGEGRRVIKEMAIFWRGKLLLQNDGAVEYFNTIVVQPHRKLVTNQGRGFHVRCRYQTRDKTVTNAVNVRYESTFDAIASAPKDASIMPSVRK